MKSASLWLMPLAAIILTGCPIPPIGDEPGAGGPRPGGPAGWGDDDDDDDFDPTPHPGPVASPALIAAVAGFFREKCVACHGEGRDLGGLGDVMDVAELRRRGLLDARAESSPLFRLVSEPPGHPAPGAVSPATGRPAERATDQELESLRQWIDAGAPELRGSRTRIALPAYASRLRSNLARLSPAERAGQVFVSFHAVYNNRRYLDAELRALADATLKLLNGLDPLSARVGANADGAAVVFDDDHVPLAVRFDPRRFNLDADDVERLVRLTNRRDADGAFCDVPVVPVLDFLHVGSSDAVFDPINGVYESGYSNVVVRRLLEQNGLLAPGQPVFDAIGEQAFVANGFANVSTISALDVLAAVDPDNFDRASLAASYGGAGGRGLLARACFSNSGVSPADRCVDRLGQSYPPGGSTWLTWDFLPSANPTVHQDVFAAHFVGPANPPADPLQPAAGAFVADGGQGIFQLPNYMLGFLSFNGDLQLVSNQPVGLASAPGEAGVLGAGGGSCSGCHANFALGFNDAALPTALGPNGGGEYAQVLGLLRTQEEWDATVAIDSQRYAEELRSFYLTRDASGPPPDGIAAFGSQFLADLSAEDVAAELGFDGADELLGVVDNDVDLAVLFRGGVSRSAFQIAYQTLVDLTPLSGHDFLRTCLAREVDAGSDHADGDLN